MSFRPDGPARQAGGRRQRQELHQGSVGEAEARRRSAGDWLQRRA